jgi:hypothetical protein
MLDSMEGHYAWFAVPTNVEAVSAVRHNAEVRCLSPWWKLALTIV